GKDGAPVHESRVDGQSDGEGDDDGVFDGVIGPDLVLHIRLFSAAMERPLNNPPAAFLGIADNDREAFRHAAVSKHRKNTHVLAKIAGVRAATRRGVLRIGVSRVGYGCGRSYECGGGINAVFDCTVCRWSRCLLVGFENVITRVPNMRKAREAGGCESICACRSAYYILGNL